MSRCVIGKIFKTAPYPKYFAIQTRSKVCDHEKAKKPKKVVKPSNCFDQFKAILEKDTLPVSHVIMDLDGVILEALVPYYNTFTDSTQYNLLAHEEYLMKWKKKLKVSTKYKISGLRTLDAGKIITDEYDMPFGGQVYAHGVWQLQRELFHQAKVMKGVDDVVCYFIKQKMPLAMITSQNEKAFKILYSKLHGFEKYFCHVVRSDQVVDGKPKPEILIKAARMFYNGPQSLSQYLVIDSSYQGILAAKAAGMQSILRADRKMPKDMQAAAHTVLYSMDEFDPTEFNLPPMRIKKN